MNILYVNATFWGGGAEKVARQLYYGIKDGNTKTYFAAGRYQKDLPEDVAVLYKNFLGRAVSAALGVANHNFLFFTLSGRKKIIDLIRRENIDIVHFHNTCGNYIGPADIKAISKYCRNIVITMHDMWLITGCCPHGMSCNKWRDGNKCQKCGGNEWLKKGTIWAGKYLQSKTKNFSGKGICFVSPSEWLINKCKHSYLVTENIRLIPNGIDVKSIKPYNKKEMRKKHQIPLNKHVLLFSANQMNSPYKGADYLIEALLNVPEKENYCLLIVGNGKIDKLNLCFETHITGYIKDTQTMNELYSAADIFLLPSMADTFPLTMLEAMASGTPVLAFKTGGIPEAVNDEVGWCVEAGDSIALANMLISIFDHEEEYVQKVQQCRKYIVEKFSEDLMLERYRGLYRECMNENEKNVVCEKIGNERG